MIKQQNRPDGSHSQADNNKNESGTDDNENDKDYTSESTVSDCEEAEPVPRGRGRGKKRLADPKKPPAKKRCNTVSVHRPAAHIAGGIGVWPVKYKGAKRGSVRYTGTRR